ncbi:MAG: hypothetical protein FJY95_02185 [Candidatus Handelsmanbacteria bacterium]|nr:hypothetical protein [Candidatus Handelsmanbacteria bacterium]
MSRFGELRGIAGISPPKSREILPYAISRATLEPKSAADPDGRDYFSNLGVDMHYGLASNLSLNAPVNPDFGQVEADPAVLNLSVFETFYEERRPFFVEGSQLFYSRRIGRQPGRLAIPAGYGEIDRREFTNILGAPKLTGKTSGKTSFGLIEAITGEEHVSGEAAGPVSRRFLVEPRTNFLVGRLQQDVFKGKSNVGLLATAVNRARTGSAYTGGGIGTYSGTRHLPDLGTGGGQVDRGIRRGAAWVGRSGGNGQTGRADAGVRQVRSDVAGVRYRWPVLHLALGHPEGGGQDGDPLLLSA